MRNIDLIAIEKTKLHPLMFRENLKVINIS